MIGEIFKLIIIFVSSCMCISAASDIAINDTYRLPNNSYPLKYDLWLKVNIESNSTFFEGHVKIHIKIKEPSDSVTLHSKELKIRQINLQKIKSLLKYENLAYNFEEAKDFLVINLPFKTFPGDEISLEIQYQGHTTEASDNNDNNKGLLIASYSELNETRNYIFTEFEPVHARKCLPCYDEPALRAVISLEIEHHSSYNAISNMPVSNLVQSSKYSDYVVTKFQDTPVMQMYILAFVISKFKYIQNNSSRLTQRIYARDQRIDNGDLSHAVDLIDKLPGIFEEYFMVNYSLPKLDHVITPHFYTAIENWGIIGYDEGLVLETDKLESYRVFLHEFAHQFFGNLVGPKWWSYIWLNEGIAKFYDIELAIRILPNETENIERHWQTSRFKSIMIDGATSKALNFYPETPDEIREKFSAVTYYKGAIVLRMFQEAIGHDTWRKGMIYYLKNNQYSSAEPSDLHKAIQKSIDEDFPDNKIDIDFLMKPWEDQAGFPRIKVSLENGNLILTQQRNVDDDNEHLKNVTFNIPITYSTSSRPDFDDLTVKFWMTKRRVEINNFTDDWIIINNKNIGYYRVDYEESLWNGIIDQLNKNHSAIHYLNREWLFNAIHPNIEDKKFNYTLLLRLINYLKNEDNHHVIKASSLVIATFLRTYEEDSEVIESTVQDLMQVVYEKIKHRKDMFLIKQIACEMSVPNCLSDSTNEVIEKLNQPQIDYEFYYCNRIRFANQTVFETFYNFTKKLKDDINNYAFFEGLGCIKNPQFYEKVLNILIDPEWNTEGSNINSHALMNNLGTQANLEVFINFLDKNYLKIIDEKPKLLLELLLATKDFFLSDEHVKRLKKIETAANEIDTNSLDD